MPHAVTAALPAFLASLVEFVEALTVVLAVGATRGISSALWGTLAAALTLTLVVAFCGPALGPAVAGAALAGIVVIVAGVMLAAPLARVPENSLKLCVGIMLSAFGTFWAGEGAGVLWPAEDVSLPLLIAGFALAAGVAYATARRPKLA